MANEAACPIDAEAHGRVVNLLVKKRAQDDDPFGIGANHVRERRNSADLGEIARRGADSSKQAQAVREEAETKQCNSDRWRHACPIDAESQGLVIGLLVKSGVHDEGWGPQSGPHDGHSARPAKSNQAKPRIRRHSADLGEIARQDVRPRNARRRNTSGPGNALFVARRLQAQLWVWFRHRLSRSSNTKVHHESEIPGLH